MSHWALPALAVMLIAYGAVSGRLRSTPVSQAMVFVTLGLLVGNRALDLFGVGADTPVIRHLAEATLTLVLFCDAIRVNRGRLRRESGVPARLLGIGLPLTIVAGTLAAVALFPSLDLWTAAALATMLAPTDAALGLPVVTDPRLPSRIRQGLNVESGLNDGVCVPLLIIFLTIAQAEEGVGHVEPVRVVVEEIGVGAAAGVVAGALGAWVLRMFTRRGWMEGTWRQIDAAATALLAYTLAAALGGSGFIAAFTGGIVFGVVAAVFVLILLEGTELPERPLMLTVVTWTVALSVYAHGLTARPGATRYADWYHARHEHHGSCPRAFPCPSSGPAFPHSTSGDSPFRGQVAASRLSAMTVATSGWAR